MTHQVVFDATDSNSFWWISWWLLFTNKTTEKKNRSRKINARWTKKSSTSWPPRFQEHARRLTTTIVPTLDQSSAKQRGNSSRFRFPALTLQPQTSRWTSAFDDKWGSVSWVHYRHIIIAGDVMLPAFRWHCWPQLVLPQHAEPPRRMKAGLTKGCKRAPRVMSQTIEEKSCESHIPSRFVCSVCKCQLLYQNLTVVFSEFLPMNTAFDIRC